MTDTAETRWAALDAELRRLDSEEPPKRGLARVDERIPVGEYMTIAPFRYKSVTQRHLEDGTVIKPLALLGKIHLTEIPQPQPDVPLTTHIKHLMTTTIDSLRELADRCEKNDPHFKGMDAFYGISHFANSPIAERLGFEVYEAQNTFSRWLTRIQGKNIIREKVQNNAEWRERYGNSSRHPKEAFISRAKLIMLYGSGSQNGSVISR